jgi:tRNA nucleotidyltransferase/poly(A) polymerase
MSAPQTGAGAGKATERPPLAAAFEILGIIRGHGHAAVIVGGAVRDHVMGRPLTDVDIATDMPLEALSSLFRTHEVGRSKEFETVVVTHSGHAFEISRFRRGSTPPSPEGFDPLREDTAHRDFTINALVMGADGGVVDLQGGLADLRLGVVRAVGSPEERFSEDPVRILRAVRFAACLAFTIEEHTGAAVADCAPRLANVAGERVGKEILKMASQPGEALATAVLLMDRFGLLGMIIPEVRKLRGLPQPVERQPAGDAWEHTLAALRASDSSDPAINLAVLLHGIGERPATREEQGRHRYRGHDGAGDDLVEAVARRLFLPQRMRAAIAFAVEHRLQAGRLGELRRSKRLALIDSEHWTTLRALAICDCAARGAGAPVARLEAAFREAEEDAASTGHRRGGAPVITGARVMELTGLAPGPRVGEIRRRVSAWAQDNRIEDRALIETEVGRLGREFHAES